MCEFTFEENSLGNIFAEIKNNKKIFEVLIATTIYTFMSGSAVNLSEPFPAFLLK